MCQVYSQEGMSDGHVQAGGLSPSLRARDPRAFLAAAYDACANDLYRYALMVLADPTAAEDAVQQAFVKLAGMGRRVLAIESCREYLRTAVRNECWRLLDQRRRRPEPIEAASAAAMLEATTPGGIDDDERRRLEAALRALPAEQREVVHLKVYEDRTFQEIADWLGVSINTAASRYRYAIEKLRERLGAERAADGGSYGI